MLAEKTPEQAYALYNAQNYIKYENFMMFPINTIKWWIIQFVYGIANFASELLTHVVGVGGFLTKQLNGSGELGQWINGARIAGMTLATAYLIYVAIRFVVAKEPPQIKNVILQVIVSVFLMVSLSDITTTLVEYSTSWYNGFTQTDTKTNAKDANKDVSDLPFQVLANSTNDIEYLIKNNFDGSKAPAKTKVTIPTNSISKNIPTVKYGFNDLTKTDVNEGKVDFDQVIQWPDVDGGGGTSSQGYLNKLDGGKKGGKGKFKFGWLIYESKSYTDESGKLQVTAPDIPRVGTTIFAFGGYPRFQVDFFPLLIVLGSLIVAYAFASYAIIKSFLELGLMNVLGIFLFAVDLDSGSKTKQVIQAIFSTSLLVALQGFEIAFYKIAMLWGMSEKNAGHFGTGATGVWVFVIFSLVATMLVITGSDKVTQFFGVDTGAQHGLRAMGSAIYSAKQIGKGAKAVATSPLKTANGIKNARDNLGHKFNTQGSMKRDAKQQAKNATRQQVVDQMAGVTSYGQPTTGNFGANGNSTKVGDLGSASNFNQEMPNSNDISPSSVSTGMAGTQAPEPELETSATDPMSKVAGQIKPTPSAKKATAKAINKGVKASEKAQRRQANRSAIAQNMASALHNAKNIAQGKEADSPMRSLQGQGKVDQLAKPYSKNDPTGEGLSYTKENGIDGVKQSAKRALSTPPASEQTKQLQSQLKQDKQALAQAQASGASPEERQMLQNNVADTRQALNESIDQDRREYAIRQSNEPQKLSELPRPANRQAVQLNKENISRNQQKVGQTRLSSGKQQRVQSSPKVNALPNSKPVKVQKPEMNSTKISKTASPAPAKISKNGTPTKVNRVNKVSEAPKLPNGSLPKSGGTQIPNKVDLPSSTNDVPKVNGDTTVPPQLPNNPTDTGKPMNPNDMKPKK